MGSVLGWRQPAETQGKLSCSLSAAVPRLMEPLHTKIGWHLGLTGTETRPCMPCAHTHLPCTSPCAVHSPVGVPRLAVTSLREARQTEPSLDSAFAPAFPEPRTFHSPKVPSWRMNNRLLARLRPPAPLLEVATPCLPSHRGTVSPGHQPSCNAPAPYHLCHPWSAHAVGDWRGGQGS